MILELNIKLPPLTFNKLCVVFGCSTLEQACIDVMDLYVRDNGEVEDYIKKRCLTVAIFFWCLKAHKVLLFNLENNSIRKTKTIWNNYKYLPLFSE